MSDILKGKKLAILGSGNMAQNIGKGLLKSKAMEGGQIALINPVCPDAAQKTALELGVLYQEAAGVKEADIVILAFKPQNFGEAMTMYRPYLHPGQLIISILASLTIETMEAALPAGCRLIRTMPNLALAVLESATLYSVGSFATAGDEELATAVFGAMGQFIRISEDKIDAATALAGCGPAYLFYLMEGMEEAAVKAGLAPEPVKAITLHTIYGAARLLLETGEDFGQMRQKVCSPQGMTIAAIENMGDNNFYAAILSGFAAACNRAEELRHELKATATP